MRGDRLHERQELPSFGELGGLDYDPLEDKLLCHVCGHWYRNLAQHARLSHGLSAAEYRGLAGLNRTTRLVSPSMRERLREVTAPLIARLRAEGKLARWNEDRAKLAKCKQAAAEVLHIEGISPEGRRHRQESWNPQSREERAEQTRRRNLDGELRAEPKAIGDGLRRYYAEHPEQVDADRLREQGRHFHVTEKTARDLVCPRCGAAFRAMSHREKYCPPCRPLAAREYGAARKRAKREN